MVFISRLKRLSRGHPDVRVYLVDWQFIMNIYNWLKRWRTTRTVLWQHKVSCTRAWYIQTEDDDKRNSFCRWNFDFSSVKLWHRLTLKLWFRLVPKLRLRKDACQGGHFNFFLGGRQFFFIFQCHRTIEKLEKQHFICSNLTLFIVPFFLSFFLLFFFFSFFFFLFSFFFFLGGGGVGGGGRWPPAPFKWHPWCM